MKYLGVDWGLKTVGLAISEGQLASPLGSFRAKTFNDAVSKLLQAVKENDIDLVVLGKPEGEMGKAVERVAAKVKEAGVNVVLQDETLTTKEALEKMIAMGHGKKKRRDDHAIAAALILQQFLDQM